MVTSCRHTHRRKSAGITRNWRSTAITLGYTSSSSPPSGPNGSYWPRMPCDTNASTAPVCAPVMRPLMTPGFAVCRRRRSSRASTGWRRGSTRGRSTIRASGIATALDEPGDLTHRHLGASGRLGQLFGRPACGCSRWPRGPGRPASPRPRRRTSSRPRVRRSTRIGGGLMCCIRTSAASAARRRARRGPSVRRHWRSARTSAPGHSRR